MYNIHMHTRACARARTHTQYTMHMSVDIIMGLADSMLKRRPAMIQTTLSLSLWLADLPVSGGPCR